MPVTAVIFTPSFPARRLLGVPSRMVIISFTILAASRGGFSELRAVLFRPSPVACPHTVQLPILFTISHLANGCRSRRREISVPQDRG